MTALILTALLTAGELPAPQLTIYRSEPSTPHSACYDCCGRTGASHPCDCHCPTHPRTKCMCRYADRQGLHYLPPGDYRRSLDYPWHGHHSDRRHSPVSWSSLHQHHIVPPVPLMLDSSTARQHLRDDSIPVTTARVNDNHVRPAVAISSRRMQSSR